jgi:hypothetical protein
MMDDDAAFGRLLRGELAGVPQQFEIAARESLATGIPIFHSRNRRAAAWGRRNAKLLLRDAKKRKRSRTAGKAARKARRVQRRN